MGGCAVLIYRVYRRMSVCFLVGNLDLEFGLGGNMSCICFGQVVGCFLGGNDKHTPFQVILGS